MFDSYGKTISLQRSRAMNAVPLGVQGSLIAQKGRKAVTGDSPSCSSAFGVGSFRFPFGKKLPVRWLLLEGKAESSLDPADRAGGVAWPVHARPCLTAARRRTRSAGPIDVPFVFLTNGRRPVLPRERAHRSVLWGPFGKADLVAALKRAQPVGTRISRRLDGTGPAWPRIFPSL